DQLSFIVRNTDHARGQIRRYKSARQVGRLDLINVARTRLDDFRSRDQHSELPALSCLLNGLPFLLLLFIEFADLFLDLLDLALCSSELNLMESPQLLNMGL